MSKLPTYCPRCGKVVPKGRRCNCRPRPKRDGNGRKRRPTPRDRRRAELEPWRRAYGTKAYREARQEAIARTRGRCADCGKVCAWWDGSRWRTEGMDGEVDHVRALSEGGTNDPANLELRCRSCHRRRDARRRRGEA